jgi:protein gp37
MNETKIEWCNYTWNPIVGCKRGCHYCYARKIHQRFHPNIPFNEISNWDERLEQPLKVKKPSRIFVGSMSDIEYWRKYDINNILEIIKQCPQHTFMFLTKSPYTYRRIRKYPQNCWLGFTVTNKKEWGQARKMVKVKRNNLKFINIEPILDRIDTSYFWLFDWIILGGLTPKPIHKQQWIKDFLDNGRKMPTPVFMKNNLNWHGKLRQEFPKMIEEI